MKKLFFSLLLILVVSFARSQSLPNYWVPTTGTDTYSTNITNFGAVYSNKIAFVRFVNANTGASTVEINGLGPIDLKRWDGDSWEDVVSGDIPAGSNAILTYDNGGVFFKTVIYENIGSGGGSQDLQSVLDEGAIATLSGPLTITGVQDVGLGTSLNKLNTVGIFSTGGTNISTNDGSGVSSSLIATSAQASLIFDNSTNENTIDLNGNINMSTVGPSFYSSINMEDASVGIAVADNDNTQLAILEVSDGIKINDTFANRGIQGLADYSANIQANDFTQKVYVDTKMTNPMTTQGDIVVGGASGSPARLADVATGNALISGGIGVAPSYGKIGISTHVSGLGSSVATVLGTNVGTNGSLVVLGGAGGSPASLTLTNATGLPGTSVINTPAGNIAATTAQAAINELDGEKASLYTTYNRQTGSYTLVLSDASKTVEQNVASANDLTVPANSSVAFQVGTRITIVQYGSGLTTVVGAGSVTIRASSGLLTSPGQFVPMVLQKIATDEWYLWNGTQAGVFAGTYTPTLTNVANVSASTAYVCMYMRVGNVVTVSGRIDIDPTVTATGTQLGISLPVASNFTSTDQSGGTAAATAIAGQSAAIRSDATNDRAELIYNAVDITNQPMYFSFTYQVL